MKENSRFLNSALESPAFLNESAAAPKVKAHGSSSSNLLNRFFAAVSQDLQLLAARSNILATRGERILSAQNATYTSLTTALEALTTRVDAIEAATEVFADLYTSLYVVQGKTTCRVDHLFGQATLPRLSTESLLVLQTDSDGRYHVSPSTEISYSYSPTPNEFDYKPAPEAISMLRREQAWIGPSETASAFWIKVKAPLQYKGLTPNVLEIYPIPVGGLDLAEVSYQKAGTSFSSTWYSLDMSYLPGYNAANGRVEAAGPVRLHLPGDPVSQIRMKFIPRQQTAWGLFNIKVEHVQYSSRATLTVQDPHSRSIGDIVLHGKDPNDLAALAIARTGNELAVDLKTTDSSRTPVITGALLRV